MTASETFREECVPKLVELRTSVTFAMSLGAKEHFHTNFMAYVLESKIADLECAKAALFAALLEPALPPPQEPTTYITWREKDKLDLIVIAVKTRDLSPLDTATEALEAGRRSVRAIWGLVVEAKLKSLATNEQLVSYSGKLRDMAVLEHPDYGAITFNVKGLNWVTRLLSMENPALAAQKGTDWKFVAWKDVATSLAACCESLSDDKTFTLHRSLAVDYAKGLLDLSSIVESAHRYATKAALDDVTTLGSFQSVCTNNELRAARIYDLVSKLAFDRWRQQLLASYAETWGRLVTDDWHFDSYTYFSRGVAAVGFQFQRTLPHEQRHVSIGVQIQGESYRHFVKTEAVGLRLETTIAEPLIDGWFRHAPPCRSYALTGYYGQPVACIDGAVPPSRSTNLNKFDSNKFLYSSANVCGLTLSSIADLLNQSMSTASTLLPEIDDLIVNAH